MVGVGLAFGVLGPGPQSVRSSSRPRVAAWKAQQDAARAQAAEQATQAKTGRVRVGANKMLADFRANAPMVDMHLHGPTRGHHKFTVVSMVSRREGRTFSDLACGTGTCRIYCGTRIHRGLPGDVAAAGYGDAGFIPCLIQPGMMRPGTAGFARKIGLLRKIGAVLGYQGFRGSRIFRDLF